MTGALLALLLVLPVPNPTPWGPMHCHISALYEPVRPPNPVRLSGTIISYYEGRARLSDGTGLVWVPLPSDMTGQTLLVTGNFTPGVNEVRPLSWEAYDREHKKVYQWSSGIPAPETPAPVTIWGSKTIPVPATVRGTVKFIARPITSTAAIEVDGWTITAETTVAWSIDTDTVDLTVSTGGRSWTGAFQRLPEPAHPP